MKKKRGNCIIFCAFRQPIFVFKFSVRRRVVLGVYSDRESELSKDANIDAKRIFCTVCKSLVRNGVLLVNLLLVPQEHQYCFGM